MLTVHEGSKRQFKGGTTAVRVRSPLLGYRYVRVQMVMRHS